MYGTLIEPAALAGGVHRPDWIVVDCRFDLARPDWGRIAYDEAHIPNGAYAHLDRDLSGPLTPRSGRHPLPERHTLAQTLGRLGIDRHVQVIAYDQANGAYAARLWWLLRWLGHGAVAVLDGGFAAWQRAGLPTSCARASRPERTFDVQAPHWQATPAQRQATPPQVDSAELEQLVARSDIASGRVALIDARGADRFAGDNETLDPVAGHVPGARNHPFTANLDAAGRFLAAAELRSRWLRTLGNTAVDQAIAMCGSGVTACHNLLALEVAGLRGARLYAGSWSEWIRDPARPVARGPANDPVF